MTQPPLNNEGSTKRLAMNIVNQLGDLWKVPVETRQATNDQCDDFVEALINKAVLEAKREVLTEFQNWGLKPELVEKIDAQLLELKKEIED